MTSPQVDQIETVQPSVSAQADSIADLQVAGVLAGALIVIGALLGLVWSAWSPTPPAALVLPGGRFEVLAEDESLVAGDGRYLVLTAAIGLIVSLLVWFLLPRRRGPTVLTGLAVGAIVGAALTELIGHVAGGGSFTGKRLQLSDGTRRDVVVQLPLSLHMHWLVVIETVVVALVYGLFVAFAAHDDLGRPDPVRDRLRAARATRTDEPPDEPSAAAGMSAPASVDADADAQHRWGHSDAAGALQQRDLPPQ